MFILVAYWMRVCGIEYHVSCYFAKIFCHEEVDFRSSRVMVGFEVSIAKVVAPYVCQLRFAPMDWVV